MNAAPAGSVAVIDIGSNSIKILVAARDASGTLRAQHYRTIDARISAGISRTEPRLSEEGMARGLAAITSLLADATAHAASRLILVATSAVRDARNGADFILANAAEDAEAAARIAAILPHVPPGPWLDVGCSTGSSLRAAAARGLDAEGIELTTGAATSRLRTARIGRRSATSERGLRVGGLRAGGRASASTVRMSSKPSGAGRPCEPWRVLM